ncbi:serine/threonine protein kinase [bacterium]|nr:serine/threonine protein kinase [bacterium]
MTKYERGFLEQGSLVGPYKIVAKIGQGGMGNVYKAWDPGLKRFVAIKTLSESLLDNEEAARRFMREAQSMAHLKHDNIVSIFYIAHEQGLYYFAMEYVEGQTLSALINQGKNWELHELIEVTRQIVSGLLEAHQNNIIHRDLKPANIIIDLKNRIRILDFGLSKLLTETSTLTADGGILGTPDYMSPEQAQGIGVDYRTDIYSLGATLYHLLSGAPPFSGSTPISVAVKHINEPLPPLKPLNTDMPDEIITMVYRMMSKKAALRFQSYDSILAELETIERRYQHAATGISSSTRGQGSVTGTDPSAYKQTGALPSDQPRRTHRKSISTKPVPPRSSKPYIVPPTQKKSKLPLVLSLAVVLFIGVYLVFRMSTGLDHPGALDTNTAQSTDDSAAHVTDAEHRDAIALKKQVAEIPHFFDQAQEIFDEKTGPALSGALRDMVPTFETSATQYEYARILQKKASTPAEYAFATQALRKATINSNDPDAMYEHSLRMMEQANKKAAEHNERVRQQIEEQERYIQEEY